MLGSFCSARLLVLCLTLLTLFQTAVAPNPTRRPTPAPTMAPTYTPGESPILQKCIDCLEKSQQTLTVSLCFSLSYVLHLFKHKQDTLHRVQLRYPHMKVLLAQNRLLHRHNILQVVQVAALQVCPLCLLLFPVLRPPLMVRHLLLQ